MNKYVRVRVGCKSASPSVRLPSLSIHVCSYVKNKTEHSTEHKRNQRLTSTNEPANLQQQKQQQTNLTDYNFDFFSTKSKKEFCLSDCWPSAWDVWIRFQEKKATKWNGWRKKKNLNHITRKPNTWETTLTILSKKRKRYMEWGDTIAGVYDFSMHIVLFWCLFSP